MSDLYKNISSEARLLRSCNERIILKTIHGLNMVFAVVAGPRLPFRRNEWLQLRQVEIVVEEGHTAGLDISPRQLLMIDPPSLNPATIAICKTPAYDI